MPIIDMFLLEGYGQEKKEKMMKDVTTAIVESLEVPAEAVRIMIREEPKSNYAVGGIPKSKG